MVYLDLHKISFEDISIKGFRIVKLDNIKFDISDIEVVFQTNRTITLNITTNDVDLNKYLINNKKLSNMEGIYYHYRFFATIDSYELNSAHIPFYKYQIIIDLIEFTKDDIFFINSKDNFNLKIIPTKNLFSYMQKINQLDLFDFKNIKYEEYNKKYRYLLELSSFVYSTPILIEKIYISQDKTKNIIFQSQNINEKIVKNLDKNYYIMQNNHFNPKLEKYLDNYLELIEQNDLLDILLYLYFINNMYSGKMQYDLNDISGFIDLFDGIYQKLNGSLEKKEFICSECSKKSKTKQKVKSLEEKIKYILDYLEPELKQYEIDKDNGLAKTLSDFRNMVRHQKPYKKFNLEKLSNFTKGVLRLYIVKNILKIDKKDYDIDRILSGFNIYPLVKHKYRYKNEEIIIYNTIRNTKFLGITENSIYYQAIILNDVFKEAKSEDFIYDESFTKEIKKIYIDSNDEIRNALIFFGIIIWNNTIIEDKNALKPLTVTYDELLKHLELE